MRNPVFTFAALAFRDLCCQDDLCATLCCRARSSPMGPENMCAEDQGGMPGGIRLGESFVIALERASLTDPAYIDDELQRAEPMPRYLLALGTLLWAKWSVYFFLSR